MSNFTFSHDVFYAICILKAIIATFQLSSAASLNLEWSQNGVLGNALKGGEMFYQIIENNSNQAVLMLKSPTGVIDQ